MRASGLSERTIHYISDVKEDPDWVREFRLQRFEDISERNRCRRIGRARISKRSTFDKIRYYLSRRAPSRSAVGKKCRTT